MKHFPTLLAPVAAALALVLALAAAGAALEARSDHPAVLTLNGARVPPDFATSAPALVLALAVPADGAREAEPHLADLELHLSRNDRLYAPNYRELELNTLTDQVTVRQAGPPAVSCLYIGTVHQAGRAVPGSVAGVSLCNGVEGEFAVGDAVWRVQPERDRRRSDEPAYRLVPSEGPEHRRRAEDGEPGSSCGVESESGHGHGHGVLHAGWPQSAAASEQSRRRYGCPNGTPRHAEVLVVNDNARWKALGDTTASRAASVFNIAYAWYANGNFSDCVDIVLVGQLMFTHGDPPGMAHHCNEVDPTRPSLGPGCWGTCPCGSSVNCTLASTDPKTSDHRCFLLSRFGSFMSGIRTQLQQSFGTTYDAAHLFSGDSFLYPVIGYAGVGTLCVSYGVNSMTSDSDFFNAALFAHELGHNFGMSHTSAGLMMSCCGDSQPWFSDVSLSQASTALPRFTCLSQNATRPATPPVCGNGLLENGEECDNGFLNDTCCLSTCRLAPACRCANTDKCCINGAFSPAGTVCRAAQGPCDFAEACTGLSSQCPDDLYKLPNVTCVDSIGGNGTCYLGACVPSRWQQCSGSSLASPQCVNYDCDSLWCGSPGSTWCDYGWSYGPLDGSPCNAELTKFCLHGVCVNMTEVAPGSWAVSAWSGCMREAAGTGCGRGFRNRTAECKYNNQVVSVTQCVGTTKPQTVQECFDFSCTRTRTRTKTKRTRTRTKTKRTRTRTKTKRTRTRTKTKRTRTRTRTKRTRTKTKRTRTRTKTKRTRTKTKRTRTKTRTATKQTRTRTHQTKTKTKTKAAPARVRGGKASGTSPAAAGGIAGGVIAGGLLVGAAVLYRRVRPKQQGQDLATL